MTIKDKELISSEVENEGLDYTFAHKTDFHEIEDSQFHELRLKYITARQNLIDYVGLENI